MAKRGRELLAVAMLACAGVASAAPPFGPAPEPKRAVAPKPVVKKVPEKIAPAAPVVPAKCPESTALVSAVILLAELQSQKVRFAELRRGEAALKEAQEILNVDRMEVELARAELFGNTSVPTPPPRSEDIAKVAATVKAMKPAAAAPIITNLDPTLATEVLRALAKPAAAAILEKVPAELAAELVKRLAAPAPDLGNQG